VELFAAFDGFAVARRAVRSILRSHFTAGLALAALAGVALSIMQRDRRILLSLTWVVVVVSAVALLVGAYEPVRYAVTAVPAYCLAAASLAAVANGRRARIAATAILMAACAGQVWASAGVRPRGARGYEEAARFVVEKGGSPTVLFSGLVDTGYFVFFVRKHDPLGRSVVLRADKLLTTSLMGQLAVEDRIDSPEEIYPLLGKYGTKFIVIEDRDTGEVVIDWLRRELTTRHFVERQRIPIVSSDPRLMGVSLAVYEYLDARPPDPDAEINIRIPIVGREIQLKLSDVLDPSGSGSKD
jgi:hypothetical protein